MKYILNKNEGGESVIHSEHPWEVCNTDAAEDKSMITQVEAAGMLEKHEARTCAHCMADSWLKGAYD